MCRLATIAATIHSKEPNRRNFRVWNSHGQRGHDVTWPWLFRRGIFGGSGLQLYRRLHHTQCNRPS